ncbi:hypothetical protein [Singulisphaera sp. PoT]|uniref:hypothetical protein n=1 Tax=Singulisphaera sp. PoT TaxID=3411797 RepID=UPI003BF5A140
MFSKLKQALRPAKARTVGTLIGAMGDALRTIVASDIAGWYGHSGYGAGQIKGGSKRKLV